MPVAKGLGMRSGIDVKPEVVGEVAVRSLPRRPMLWPKRVTVVLVLTLLLVGFLGLTGRTDKVALTITAAVLLIAAIITLGHRKWQRGRSIDKTIEAINAAIRTAAPTRDLVVAKRWRKDERSDHPVWIGIPYLFRIAYPADVIDSDPHFLDTLVVQVSNRMGVPYRVAKNDSRNCIVDLVVDDTEPEETDSEKDELSTIISAEIPDATVTTIERDAEGAITKLEFGWQPKQSARASKAYIQKNVTSVIREVVNDSSLVGVYDIADRKGTLMPLTPLADRIPNPPRNEADPMKVVFGRFRSGRECIWDLDAPIPHLLIVGGTGGGKTVLLLTLLMKLPISKKLRKLFRSELRAALADLDVEHHKLEEYYGGVEIYPIDPKRLGLFDLDLIPGAHKAATREVGITEMLLTVKERMDERYAFLEKYGPHLRKVLPPLILVIDEGEEVNEILNDWWQSGEGKEHWCARFGLEKPPSGTKHPVMRMLGSVLRLGREARVHVILASQQAASSWLSTSSRSQFAVRIALRNLEASTSMMTFGSLAATEGLESVAGRAWVSIGMGVTPEHAQIFWTPKLEKNLPDHDRKILHGLGIKLKDDADYQPPVDVDEYIAEPEKLDPTTPEMATAAVPDPELSEEQQESESGDGLQSFELAVSDLEPGMTILVDVNGDTLTATIDSVDADEDDDGYTRISFTTESGEERLSSRPDDDEVTILLSPGR